MSREWRAYRHDVIEYGGYVREFVAGLTPDAFRADRRAQHAVLRDLEVVGEAVKRLPPEVLARYPDIPWRRIMRFRDRLAHGYFDRDLAVGWDVVENHLPALLTAAREILQREDEQMSGEP